MRAVSLSPRGRDARAAWRLSGLEQFTSRVILMRIFLLAGATAALSAHLALSNRAKQMEDKAYVLGGAAGAHGAPVLQSGLDLFVVL